jgi:hypothetical protein
VEINADTKTTHLIHKVFPGIVLVVIDLGEKDVDVVPPSVLDVVFQRRASNHEHIASVVHNPACG